MLNKLGAGGAAVFLFSIPFLPSLYPPLFHSVPSALPEEKGRHRLPAPPHARPGAVSSAQAPWHTYRYRPHGGGTAGKPPPAPGRPAWPGATGRGDAPNRKTRSGHAVAVGTTPGCHARDAASEGGAPGGVVMQTKGRCVAVRHFAARVRITELQKGRSCLLSWLISFECSF